MCNLISGECEEPRGRMKGCPCHQLECYDMAKKGGLFICPNNLKGVHGPYAESYITEHVAHLHEAQQYVFRDEFNHIIMDDFRTHLQIAYGKLIGNVRLRWGFIFTMLYRLIWRGRNIEVLKGLYLQFQEERRAGKSHHRVILRFFMEDGDLFTHVMLYMQGSPIHVYLDECWYGYEHALFDGSSGEGVHRDLNAVRRAASHSEFRYKAACVRTKQNFEEYDMHTGGKRTTKRFEHLWKMYKSILSRNRFPSLIRPVRLKTKTFLQKVYRYGLYSIEDWRALDGLVPTTRGGGTIIPDDTGNKLQQDFLKKTLRPNVLYTLNRKEDIDPAQVADPSSNQSAVQAVGIVCFEVLDLQAHRRVTPHQIMEDKMAVPALIQYWEIVEGQAESLFELPSSVHARPSLDTGIVDLIGLASAKCVFRTLCEWHGRAQSHMENCIVLSKRSLAMDMHALPWSWSKTPLYLMCQELHRQGFRPGDIDRNSLPIADDEMSYSTKDINSKGPYLLCLLDRERLSQLGYTSLPANGHVTFLQCVFFSKRVILEGQPAKEYRLMLKDLDTAGTHAIEDGHHPELEDMHEIPCIRDGEASSDESSDGGVMTHFAKPPVKRRRIASKRNESDIGAKSHDASVNVGMYLHGR